MSKINHTFINALLADAAYAERLRDGLRDVDLFEVLTERMTPTLATFIATNFEVVSHKETEDDPRAGVGSGFDATAWRGRAGTLYAGQVYVSMQGTLGLQDFIGDLNLASPFGIARNQIKDMVNWWNQITTSTDETARQIRQVAPMDGSGFPFFASAPAVAGTGLLVDVANIQVNGHSLGGHLASAFARLMGDRTAGNGAGGVTIGNVTTFNSAGFTPGSESAFTELQNAMGIGATSFKGGKQTNVFAQNGLNVTTNTVTFSQIGTRVPVFNEESTGFPNHYMYKLTDALALGAAMEKLDASFTIDRLNTLLSSGANEMPKSLESALDALRRLIAGTDAVSTAVGDADESAAARVDFHQKLADVQEHSMFTALANAGTARIRDLTSLGSSSIAATAKDGDQALAYRYALKELNPFAIVGDDSLYSQHNQNGELGFFNTATGTGSTSGLTEQYLKDRAAMLFEVIKRNKDDIANVARLDVASKQLFNDVAQNITFRNGFGNDDNLKQIRFGTNASDTINGGLVGGVKDDYLYGMGGTDRLTGNEGKDYLEGGTGFDTYVFNKGDGKDTILDTDNRGQLNLGLRNTYNALRITDPKSKTGFLWADKDAGIRFEFKPLTAGATKGELILTRFIAPANVTNLPPNPDLIATTDQITIKNVDLGQATDMGNNGGVLGIKLNNDKQLVMTTGITPSPFSVPRAVGEVLVNNNILNLRERAGAVLNLAANFVSDGVSRFRVFLTEGLNTQGVNSEAAFMLVNGAEEIPFNAQGYVDIEIPAGQSQKYYQFVSIGDIDTNLTGGLKVALLDDSGSIAKNADGREIASTLSVNVTAENDQVGYTNFIVGDQLDNGIQRINDQLYGTSANDSIDGATGANFLRGGAGNDLLFNIGSATDSPYAGGLSDGAGGSGNDRLYVRNQLSSAQLRQQIIDDATDAGTNARGAILNGESGDDLIVGGRHQDFIRGGSGNDRLNGGGGDDVITGDTIKAVYDTDVLRYAVEANLNSDASRWNEVVLRGSQIITENANPDYTQGGNDTIHAGGGNDWVMGNGGNDTLYGEDGNDFMYGGHNDDTVLGGRGNDVLHGDDARRDGVNNTTGNDFVDGGAGDDQVFGNGGNREAGVSLKRTVSLQRLPNGIRDVLQEPRMATLTSRAFINAVSHPLASVSNKKAKSPFHAHLRAKLPQTARPDCTLPFLLKDGLQAGQRANANTVAVNDSIERRVA